MGNSYDLNPIGERQINDTEREIMQQKPPVPNVKTRPTPRRLRDGRYGSVKFGQEFRGRIAITFEVPGTRRLRFISSERM